MSGLRKFLFLTLLVMTTNLQTANAALAEFTQTDGAITVHLRGDFVDPYFAQKALIVAWEAGLDMRLQTERWLTWLLPRQRMDGGFDRYCQTNAIWKACKAADADDSMAATFLHLVALYEQSKYTEQSVEISKQLPIAKQKAWKLLQSLRNKQGLYRVFVNDSRAYLMDNAEVYAAFKVMAKRSEAAALEKAINRQFLKNMLEQQWKPVNEKYDPHSFYPAALAPAYRWHTGLSDAQTTEREFSVWSKIWGKAWLERTEDEYPWGIIAWGVRHIDDQHWVRCWRYRHIDSDRERGWTVLDQAVDKGLEQLGVQAIEQSCEAVLRKLDK